MIEIGGVGITDEPVYIQGKQVSGLYIAGKQVYKFDDTPPVPPATKGELMGALYNADQAQRDNAHYTSASRSTLIPVIATANKAYLDPASTPQDYGIAVAMINDAIANLVAIIFTLNPTAYQLKVGVPQQLQYVYNDDAITITSSNVATATVTATGEVTGLKNGVATITFAVPGFTSLKATCTILK